MRRHWGLLIFALAALLGLPAFALDPAGSAVEVLPAATGALDGTTIDLSNGADVYMGQQIVTGPNGQVQIIFKDNTHLVVGPGSTLLIAEYLLRNEGTASKFVIDALGGTFRFATGNSAKNAYEIRTPTGTIGVRGTRFDFDVDRQNNGETSIVLYEGAVEMCADGEQCVRLSEVCGVGVIPDQDAAEVFKRADQRAYKAKAAFHYLNNQTPLRKDFRFANVPRCRAPAQVAEANGACPNTFTGTLPNCKPPQCPSGYTGTYPNCQPPQCPSGYTGTYPNCEPPVVHECPSGYSGTWPDCVAPDDDEDDEDDDEEDDGDHHHGHGVGHDHHGRGHGRGHDDD